MSERKENFRANLTTYISVNIKRLNSLLKKRNANFYKEMPFKRNIHNKYFNIFTFVQTNEIPF